MSEVLVGVVMGSKSDLNCVKNTLDLLIEFNIPYEVRVLSAHRTPDETVTYAKQAYQRGIKVIIAAAGGAAALAGIIAGVTTVPVIGIPIKTSTLNGVDSLLSIVQMPAGVPVATVAIGDAGAKNAAVLALTILAAFKKEYQDILVNYKAEMKAKVLKDTMVEYVK